MTKEDAVIAFSWGGLAGIIAAVAWAFMVLFIAVVMVNVFRLLESTKLLVDGIRQETVPLLGELKTTVSSVNKELDRVDGIMESAGKIAQSAERLTAVVEQTVSSPLVKVAAFGAGMSRAVRRLRRDK
jgi:uncharacterized protein YoxC